MPPRTIGATYHGDRRDRSPNFWQLWIAKKSNDNRYLVWKFSKIRAIQAVQDSLSACALPEPQWGSLWCSPGLPSRSGRGYPSHSLAPRCLWRLVLDAFGVEARCFRHRGPPTFEPRLRPWRLRHELPAIGFVLLLQQSIWIMTCWLLYHGRLCRE